MKLVLSLDQWHEFVLVVLCHLGSAADELARKFAVLIGGQTCTHRMAQNSVYAIC
jgi:hypothetical protein